MGETKTCIKCHVTKPLTSDYFVIAKQNKDGFRGECKECIKLYHKSYQARNKEHLDTQKAEYRANHKQEKAATDKAYRENNVEKLADRHREYYREHRDETISKVKSYRENNLDKIREYRAQNKEQIKQREREYRKRNQDRIREREARYKAKNAETLSEKRKAHYAANREAMIQRSKAYRLQHPETVKAYDKQYARDNPDKIHAKGAKRRAVFRNAYVEPISREKVYERDNGICGLCGEKIELRYTAPHPKSLSLDHIVPLTKGGAHIYENVQIAHYGCNSRKGNRTTA